MSNKTLTILGIAAVVMVGLAVYVANVTDEKAVAVTGSAYLIQGLDPAVIKTIEIKGGDGQVTLNRSEGKFVVAEKGGYAALTGDINKLITDCLDLKQSELYTDNPENFADLGVSDDTAKSIVTFKGSDANAITGVVIGNSREQGQGTYVRLVNDDRVYVAQNVPWVKTGAADYIDKKLFSLERDKIESVTVNGPNDLYTIKSQPGTEGFVIENLPAGKQLKGSDPQSVFTALSYLNFSDVTKADKAGLDFDRMYVCRLTDSTEYKIKIAEKDGKTWIAVDAEFTDKTPITKAQHDESTEELKKKEALLIARDDATRFSLKHKGWVYEIPSYKMEWLAKPLADIIEDIPVAEAPVESEDSTQTTDADDAAEQDAT